MTCLRTQESARKLWYSIKIQGPILCSRWPAKGRYQFFCTNAPVVHWSTIRLLLSTVLTEEWATRQVDYANAFAQADLKEQVHLKCPTMFSPKLGANVVLRLLKSLNGLRQAPRTSFENFATDCSNRDISNPATIRVFSWRKELFVLCTLMIQSLQERTQPSLKLRFVILAAFSDSEQRHTFQLRDEGEIGAFLGIQITKTGSNTFMLT